MSGIEILGIAASVLQIADLGARLSVKLFTFSRKIKNAHKSIDSISQDIAATGAILQQLGSELKKDEQLRLCSQEAVSTAKSLVEECNKVFVELNNALDGGKSQTQGGRLILGWKDRLRFSFLEPQVDQLRSNLERLKSSLAVMLNVMIFAEQLRNHEALPILKEQRELIKVLVEDKETTQKRFEQVSRTIGAAPAGEKPPRLALDTQSTREIAHQTTQSSFMVASGMHHDQKLVNVEPILVPPLPVGILRWKEEIEHHSALVKKLLDEASASHHNIDHGQRHRMHEGILQIHWEEWSRLRKMYNNETLLRAFSSRHPVSRFWQAQLEQELLSSRYKEDNWMEARAHRHRFVETLPQYPGPPVLRDTADSHVDVVDNPSLPTPTRAYNKAHQIHTETPAAHRSLAPPPLSSPSSVGNRPGNTLDFPPPLQPDPGDPDNDSDDDSDDGLFSIPLSNKRSSSQTNKEVARPTLSASADLNAKNVRRVTFRSSIDRVPPVPPLDSAHQSAPALHKESRRNMRVPSRPGPDFTYAHVLYTDEHQLTAEEEEEEDVVATKAAIKLIKQEDVSSTRNALSIVVPPRAVDRDLLSLLRTRSDSYRAVGVASVMKLEESSARSYLPVSNAAEKTDRSDSNITLPTLSQVEAVQSPNGRQSAVALPASEPRTTPSGRIEHPFEEDNKDNELDDEIDANVEELSEVVGRLNALARAVGEELEVQNQMLEITDMESDRVDGGNVAEKDVVDDLLLQWTNLSTHELEHAGKGNWMQNTEKLRRIR